MAWAGTTKFIDNFARAQIFTTTPGMNGWTIKDTSSAGAPTYLCITEDGGASKLLIANTNEAEIVTLYHNNVLVYDVRKINQVWWVAQVAGVDAVTTLTMGVGSAQADADGDVAHHAWFRMEGSASTTALYYESDDATNDAAAALTGTTLAAVYKKLLIDFTQGLSDVRFFVDGALVGTTTMADLPAASNVQPFVQLQKASGTGVPSVTLAQFGVSYNWTYGA